MGQAIQSSQVSGLADMKITTIPVDQQHVEDVRDAIEQLTAPMESGYREQLTPTQRHLLYRLREQLGKWMDSH